MIKTIKILIATFIIAMLILLLVDVMFSVVSFKEGIPVKWGSNTTISIIAALIYTSKHNELDSI